jgi:hypothetical protein
MKLNLFNLMDDSLFGGLHVYLLVIEILFFNEMITTREDSLWVLIHKVF